MGTSALSVKYKSITNVVQSDAWVRNIDTGMQEATQAIWDTGATASVITKSLARKLGLKAVSMTNVTGVHGVKAVNVYYVEITLQNKNIVLTKKVTECEELSADGSVGMLVGMDVISLGDFSISNYEGKTIMSFRFPSVEDTNFCDEIEKLNKYSTIYHGRKKTGNEKCPCGSGKKYINCHGKNKYGIS